MCVSHAGIASKRLNIGSRKQHRVIPGTLVFWRQESLVEDPLPPEICAQSDPPPFEHQNFDQYPLITPQPWELAKKIQLALIGSRPRAFQRAIDEPCTLPLSPPKVGTKRDFAVFAIKIQLLSKTFAAKFFSVKTSSSKVVATSYLYIIPVRGWIVGDVPIY